MALTVLHLWRNKERERINSKLILHSTDGGDEWTGPGLVISHLCYCYRAIHYCVAAYCSQFSTFLCDSPTVCDNGWLITIVLRQTLSNAWGIGHIWHARCCENGTASVVRQPTSAWSTGPNTVSFITIVFISPEDGRRVSFRNVVHLKHISDNGQMQKQCNFHIYIWKCNWFSSHHVTISAMAWLPSAYLSEFYRMVQNNHETVFNNKLTSYFDDQDNHFLLLGLTGRCDKRTQGAK